MKYSALQQKLEVLLVLSFMDLKLKYQSSLLGFLWSFIKPLLQFCVYYTIFGLILKVASGADYALRLFFGVLIWSWFSEASSLGLNAFIGKKSIITKIKTNKLLPPLAAYLTPTMNYILNFIIFIIAYVALTPSLPAHIFTPINILVFAGSLASISIFIISVNLILANLNVFYRDIQPIWELILTYGVFLTPIIYQIPIPHKLELAYYLANPLAFPLQNLKSIFFSAQTPLYIQPHLLVCYYLYLLVFFLLACFIHRKLNYKVVDFL